MTTVVVEGNNVHEQRNNTDGEIVRVTHTCSSRRVAQVTAAKIALASRGWDLSGIGSTDGWRLPLLLPGEKMGPLLDGALSDRRVQGFVAKRGIDVIGVDASAGMPLRFFARSGDPTDALEICSWYLGD
jgi:hypothetical protein